MKNAVIYLLLIASICFMIFTSCNSSNYMTINGYAQGTTYSITYKSSDQNSIQEEVEEVLRKVDQSLSMYVDQSIISSFNNGDSCTVVDAWMQKNILVAKEIYQATDGAFNPAVSPIINAWGFGLKHPTHTDSSTIDSLLPITKFENIQLNNDLLCKTHPGATIDLNGIAQGFAVDIIAEYFDKNKITDYLIELGGEVRVKGKNKKKKDWTIGIDFPMEENDNHQLFGSVSLQNNSLATSGNYRKFYEKDGKKYVHTIHPKSGYPVIHSLLSATVITDECIYADAYATAFMVMGVPETKRFLEKNPKIKALLIYSDDDGKIQSFTTPSLTKNVKKL